MPSVSIDQTLRVLMAVRDKAVHNHMNGVPDVDAHVLFKARYEAEALLDREVQRVLPDLLDEVGRMRAALTEIRDWALNRDAAHDQPMRGDVMAEKQLTMAELVELATKYQTACVKTGSQSSTIGRIAGGVVDLLGEGSRCGAVEPQIMNGGVVIPVEWITAHAYSPDETRALGRLLFTAADAAELQERGNG